MRQPNLTSEMLRTFVTIVETGGFIKAAEHLHKTQSTISQHVKRLEQEAGVAVFQANGRKRELTASGHALLSYAKRLLLLQEEALAAIAEENFIGEIKIGVSHCLSEGIFPELLGEFSNNYPDIRIIVDTRHSTSINQAYDRGEYDISLSVEPSITTGDVISTDEVVWVGALDYPHHKKGSVAFCAYDGQTIFKQYVAEALDNANIPWQVTYKANSFSSVLAAVKAGLGVSVQLKGAVSKEVKVLTSEFGLPALPSAHIIMRNRLRGPAGKSLSDIMAKIRY